ncbi:PAS domain-containing hybrid sensor histidine kinase/response regulator [Paractinoplanes hotanensis]|uniref:histidine kinase n=1 Tax=Paractinoplanes hotanensis TaxID=2906497 RepID=A0ABT0Y2U7_9ACTN|nr:PAS domain S-box protein [Actinoplanes hotanensis]MCM4080335.1 PAS domain S-box protein [Actinoplanes hotanensis]
MEDPPAALIGVDRDGTISLTAEVRSLLGYRDEELLGRSVATLVDLPSLFTDLLSDHSPTPEPLVVHTPFRRKDGTRFMADLHLSTVRSGTGTQVWAQLREAPLCDRVAVTRSLFRSLADSAGDAIISATLDGEITYWNPAAGRLYGYTAGEAIGQSLAMLYVVDPQREMAKVLAQVVEGRPAVLGRVQRRRKDGTVLRVSVTVAPILDTAGAIVGAASITTDTGGEQRAEARFQALLEAATVAIIGVNEAGRILLVNAEAERLFGYRRHELRDQPVEILVPQAVRGAHEGLRSGFLTHPKTRPMGVGLQLQAQRKDGSQFPVEVSLSAIDTDDGLLVAAAVRDLSQQAARERLEDQLQQTRRLDSLGQLAGGVAHDINNLMAIVGGHAAFIIDDAESGAAADGTGILADIAVQAHKIQGAVARTTDLTRQMLAFGNRGLLRKCVVEVNAAVRDSTTLLERTLGEHITIDQRLADDLWPIMADPGEIEQIIINAAVNARDAMPDGGRLTVETANTVQDADEASIPDLPPGRYVRLRVRDTGNGMTPETAAKAFEPFFTTKPPGQGTGLGLSTIYGIAVRHQGHARLDSQLGQGTTLTILLPAYQGPVGSDALPPKPAEADGARYTVLVVDDQDGVREVTRRFLLRDGHTVLEAAGGPAALELVAARTEPIDLLLTDVIMPGMLGTELARRVVADLPAVRVLFISGYAQPALNKQGTLGDDAILLEKPFTEHQLRTAVAATMSSAAT